MCKKMSVLYRKDPEQSKCCKNNYFAQKTVKQVLNKLFLFFRTEKYFCNYLKINEIQII
jgi:hypothetical protein